MEKVSHTFASGIDGGPVGLRLAHAHTHFDDVYVQEVVSERKYYFFGGRRVAMRRDGMIQYIVADHVCLPCGKHTGTTSVVLAAQGTDLHEQTEGVARVNSQSEGLDESRFIGNS